MDRLIEKQQRSSGHILRTIDNLNKTGRANITLGTVEARVTGLDAKWESFLELHERIEDMATAEDRKRSYFVEEVYETTEDGYYQNKGMLLDMIRALKREEHPAPRTAPAAAPQQQLPKISLPKFSGSYTEWSTFRDLFTSMVKDNVTLSDVEKLQYLKMSLQKEPAALLASIPLTTENFAVSWTTLTDRYENKRLLVTSQIASIVALSAVKAEISSELKTLYNGTVNAVSALRALGRPVEGYDDFLVYLTVQKLDKQSRREWEWSVGSKKSPVTFEELRQFLDRRICAVEAFEVPETSSTSSSKASGSSTRPQQKSTGLGRVRSHQVSNASTPAPQRQCAFCQQEHYIVSCEAFRAKPLAERKSFVLGNNLCLNCLGHHFLRECRSQKTCRTCKAKHNSLIHEPIAIASRESTSASAPRGPAEPPSASEPPVTSTHVNLIAHNARCRARKSVARVLLATAVVNVSTAGGTSIPVRALLDQGSEASFVSESLAQRLRLPRSSASVVVTGIGATSAATSHGRVTITISSRLDSRYALEVSTLVLPRLTSYAPPAYMSGEHWPHLDGLLLADPDASSALKIDLLLGADVFSQILLPGVQKGPADAPIAQNTHLGWILSGRVSQQGQIATCSSFQLSIDDSLSSSLQHFWEQEEVQPVARLLDPDEANCEKHFVSTHSRDAEGRYTVRLPFKKLPETLGDSISAASRMLAHMEHRFSRDANFKAAYSQFLAEYEELGHMEVVLPSSKEPSLVYYLPHHGVIRESSETTKLRVVFNGSCKTNLGISLNDYLPIGPKLLPELFDIILRWRRYAIVFSADMEKMYRQVFLHPEDRDLQRILWRDSPQSSQVTYRLRTVTYGLTCAPFLALRVIRQLAIDERSRFPVGSASLLSDVYVDDVLSGADDVKSALEKQREIIELLKAGGFALRKWTSNSPELLSSLPPSLLATKASYEVPTDSSFHMLGLSWQSESDVFVFRLKTPHCNFPLSKRKVLSNIAELFDPLGFLAPVIVTAKIFMQSLWLLKIGWDDPLPERESTRWQSFYEDLSHISEIRVPRWLHLHSSDQDFEIHGFSDASEHAYAAVVYIRMNNDDNSVSLVASKTKVAPVKQVSLPRLELCAAHLLVKLVRHVFDILNLECAVHLWSDSTVTLAWIREHPVRWKTYVANRVSEIQRALPNATWHHVRSEQNPADCASRGLFASDLRSHPLWWTGPTWLHASRLDWPSSNPSNLEEPPEQRIHSHVGIRTLGEPIDLLTRYSSLNRLQRITAWCRRFLANVQLRGERRDERQLDSTLLPSELSAALTSLVRLEQSRFFPSEIAALKAKSSIAKGPLVRLTAFLDESGQLRVGGRLRHAILNADEKNPVIVPHDSPIASLLVDHVHRQTLHGGTQLTLATLRQRFWLISARSLVKTLVGRCIRCLRYRAATATQLMGDLPRERVTRSRPFYHSGIDYAGPILLRTSKGRGHKASKAYIAVFVCFATRAVHLEAVSDYSTGAFLAAFKRFTSRRGLCRTLSSDCGTNFVGADAELRSLFAEASVESNAIRATLANDGVEWRFNPPSAPHFGGLWEAAVKSVKHHLRRVVGETTLTFEEMATLLSQIEACLNSRPLQALTDDPEDLSALTPGHFLTGAPLTAVPEPNLEHLPPSRLSRWQLVQQMRDSFWSRWASEYLHQLQVRPKWNKPQAPLQVGDLVLVKNEVTTPTKWPLARVTLVHPGEDGHVRVVTVRTATSVFKRPVVKLCLLLKSANLETGN